MAWEKLIKEWGERYKMASSKDEEAAYWNCSAELLEELAQQGIKVDLQTDNQQLKAEIAAIATEFDNLGPGSCGGEHLKSFYDLVIKLRQLSAV